MAGKEELEISIAADGAVQVHIKGIKGKKCVDLMKKIEKEVGMIREQKCTSEYYEQEESSEIRRTV